MTNHVICDMIRVDFDSSDGKGGIHMSEKRPHYVQVMSPKLEDVVVALTNAKGADRGWADYANDCGINPSTMSRIINGKLKSALSVKTLDKLYQGRAATCKMSFDAFLIANGYIDEDKQRDMVDQRIAIHDKLDRILDLTEKCIVTGLYNRDIPFTRVEHVGDGTPNEEEILKLFGDIKCHQLLRVGEGDKSETCGFEFVPLKLEKDEADSERIIQENVQLAIENYATIFLEDAWNLDERLSDRVVFVFIDRILYEAFLDTFKKRRLNHYMTVLLVDIDETEVIEERPLGLQAGKSFRGLFNAPLIGRPNRRFADHIGIFTGEQ